MLQEDLADDKSRLSADVTDVEIGISSDPVTGKQASKPKDIVVFINLVDFCRWVFVTNPLVTDNGDSVLPIMYIFC